MFLELFERNTFQIHVNCEFVTRPKAARSTSRRTNNRKWDWKGHSSEKDEINRKDSIKQEAIFPEHFQLFLVWRRVIFFCAVNKHSKMEFLYSVHALAQFCPSIAFFCMAEQIRYRKVTCRRLFIVRMRMGSEIAIFFRNSSCLCTYGAHEQEGTMRDVVKMFLQLSQQKWERKCKCETKWTRNLNDCH